MRSNASEVLFCVKDLGIGRWLRRLRAKRRFLKSARNPRSKEAVINEEAHDNNALPEFLKACKETRSFKDVMNCLFFGLMTHEYEHMCYND